MVMEGAGNLIGQLHGPIPCGQGVAGIGVLQFRNGTDVARAISDTAICSYP